MLPAVKVTAAPAPDVKGDQEKDPGGQVGTSLFPGRGVRDPGKDLTKKVFLLEGLRFTPPG